MEIFPWKQQVTKKFNGIIALILAFFSIFKIFFFIELTLLKLIASGSQSSAVSRKQFFARMRQILIYLMQN